MKTASRLEVDVPDLREILDQIENLHEITRPYRKLLGKFDKPHRQKSLHVLGNGQ